MELNKEKIDTYSRMVVAFNKKLNVEVPAKLLPIMSVYATSMRAAGIDQHDIDKAVRLFSDEVHAILSDCLKEYLTIQSETFYLKLIAPEGLGAVITCLEEQFNGSFQFTRQFLKDFIADFSDEDKVIAYTESARKYAQETDKILSDLKVHFGTIAADI
jgi:hypothetical protein